jgi:hypothetical protein
MMRTLDEEHGDVVADNIPVALLGVHLEGKAADVSDGVGGATASQDSGEADEDGGLAGGVGEDAGVGELLDGLMESEGAKGAGAAGVDDTLGNALMIEAVNLIRGSLVSDQ